MKFSIIVPVYNAARYLRETLESVALQTFRDFECICVDDGSTDGSAAMIEEYCAHDRRFRFVRKQNGGEGSARNAGIETASGEWLCYLDADDVYSPDMLSVGYELIHRHPTADIVAVNRLNFEGDTPCLNPVSARSVSSELIDTSREFGGPFLSRSVCTGFYRRDVFQLIRFPSLVEGGDRVYAAECLSCCRQMAVSDVTLYLYRQHPQSAMKRPYDTRRIGDCIQYVCRYLDIVKKSGKTLDRAFRRSLVNQLVEEMPHHIRQLDRAERTEVWKLWKDSVAHVVAERVATPWGRFVCYLARIFPVPMVAAVFCEIPYGLKRKGIHR